MNRKLRQDGISHDITVHMDANPLTIRREVHIADAEMNIVSNMDATCRDRIEIDLDDISRSVARKTQNTFVLFFIPFRPRPITRFTCWT